VPSFGSLCQKYGRDDGHFTKKMVILPKDGFWATNTTLLPTKKMVVVVQEMAKLSKKCPTIGCFDQELVARKPRKMVATDQKLALRRPTRWYRATKKMVACAKRW
jgi:hypothetical protein